MCAAVYSSLLLFTLTTVSILFGMMMATEGLPLVRQERGADDRGLLTGADFLSVFMSSSLHQAYHETSTTTPEPTTWHPEDDSTYSRETRSTSLLTSSPIAQSNTEDSSSYDTTLSAHLNKLQTSSDSSDGVVVAVSVSSSVGRTLINKKETSDQNSIASEEHPSIVAEANKSEFSVEESEPITTNSGNDDYVRGYPASVQPLSQSFNHNSDLIRIQEKDKLHPIHQTVIYHNNPGEAKARSVSYSTVIQSVPHPNTEKQWNNEKHERHERHYENSNSFNNFNENKKNNSQIAAESSQVSFTTERNWEIQEKPYMPDLPTVYGKPEQNYEVDESASVMTNGRIHGIQPIPTLPTKEVNKKVDDNQKVGYVVEGRNYRKYRVEERTSDGFIVGEYGVVSHDDGSLRGVRYTADGTISPRLIYDALMKFLSL